MCPAACLAHNESSINAAELHMYLLPLLNISNPATSSLRKPWPALCMTSVTPSTLPGDYLLAVISPPVLPPHLQECIPHIGTANSLNPNLLRTYVSKCRGAVMQKTGLWICRECLGTMSTWKSLIWVSYALHVSYQTILIIASMCGAPGF